MATYADIEIEWSALGPDTPERWNETDLQLAAELGKTLLERNKDLESTLRQQQALVDDQAQEIEYLTKQTAALREVNDSRLRIYEQLEVSIQELERNNQRLAVENAADKKQIKSLCHSLDAMETRCEELTRTLEETQAAERRRKRASVVLDGTTPAQQQQQQQESMVEPEVDGQEEVLAEQVAMLTAQKDRETRRAEELEEQLTALIQENASLEEQMASYRMREEQLRSLEEELSSMHGQQYCYRCLRRGGGGGGGMTGASTATPSLMDEEVASSLMEDESSCCFDDDDDTEVQSIASETHNTVLSDNPYRVLVEKYEALLSMQRRPARQRPGSSSAATLQASRSGTASPGGPLLGRLCGSPLPSAAETNCLSLQEELQLSGEFNSSGPVSLMLGEEFGKVEEGEPREQRPDKLRGQQGQQGLYFSEAETNSSSGVSEGEVPPHQQNAATQTDLMSGGGKLLWSISAGSTADSPVVNVYGDQQQHQVLADPTESRFQRTPEYRELFSEIFSVLKRSVARSSAAAAAAANAAPTTNGSSSKPHKADHKKGGAVAVDTQQREEASSSSAEATQQTTDEPSVCGLATSEDKDAGLIEELKLDEEASPSSILSLAGQGARKSRRAKGRRERKAEQLRRKVLALSPERLSHEAQREQQLQQHTSRDQSPAVSDRSAASSKKGGRHWAKRGKPLALGGSGWPWNRGWQQPPGPSPLAAPPSGSSQQATRPTAGPSSQTEAPKAPPPPINFTSSASADVARLKRLEKTYADALRTSIPKTHRRK